jgi:hypothetical protein
MLEDGHSEKKMLYVTDIKSVCKGISDTFSYMIGVDYVTLEMKSAVV